jgi:hypothetical protein
MTCFFQVVDWYLGSVRLFNDKIGEKDRMVAEKDKGIAEKDILNELSKDIDAQCRCH